jgi:uncharacterized protein YfaS (alpha-2-macroglobulin family)
MVVQDGDLSEVVVSAERKPNSQILNSPVFYELTNLKGVDFSTSTLTSNAEIHKQLQHSSEIKIRKNFNETAFFFPDLRTNENGDIEFSFTMPEALTRWKFQALAHTKDLAFGYSSKEDRYTKTIDGTAQCSKIFKRR